MTKNDYQVRHVQLRDAVVTEENNKMILEGYAVVFDTPTVLWKDENGNEWKEIVDRNVFDTATMKDCCLKYNHGGMLLARVRGGSLSLRIDDKGLFFHAEMFNTQYARDIYTLVKEGGIDKCSFAFTVKKWEFDKENRTQIIKEIDKLYDVAVVDTPAYEQTSVNARSLFLMDIENKDTLDNVELRNELICRTYL